MENAKTKPTHSPPANFIWGVGKMIRFRPWGFWIMVLSIPLEIGMQYLAVRLPARTVEAATEGGAFREAVLPVLFLLLLIAAGEAVRKSFEYALASEIGLFRAEMQAELTHKQLSLSYELLEKKRVRDLNDRADRAISDWDGEEAVADVSRRGFDLLRNLLGYLFFGAVITLASPWLLPILTLAPLVDLLTARLHDRWLYRHREERGRRESKLGRLTRFVGDFAYGKDFRVYGLASWIRAMFFDLLAENTAWENGAALRRFWGRAASLFAILLRDGAAYAILIAMVLSGKLTPAEFVLYFAAAATFGDWIGGMVDGWNRLRSVSLVVCDYRDFIDFPDPDGSGKAKAEEHRDTPEIVFDHVSYRYEGAEEDAISDLSLRIQKGERVALVGVNGAGKTTLIKLLCGLYSPSSGEIRIDGAPQKDFRREEYYTLFSPVFQDVRTAFFSLAETVAGGEEYDHARVREAMEKAGLGEKLASLPQGIETRLDRSVNPDGIALSGGETQRLMLARALYKDAPVLVLDEPTAALDPIAESRIYQTYFDMCRGKTAIFVSHRLASTAFCDRVILLDHGKIREKGTHEELIRKGGEYKRLYEIQSVWYREEREGSEEE